MMSCGPGGFNQTLTLDSSDLYELWTPDPYLYEAYQLSLVFETIHTKFKSSPSIFCWATNSSVLLERSVHNEALGYTVKVRRIIISWQPVRFAGLLWPKVLFVGLLWEKNTARWLLILLNSSNEQGVGRWVRNALGDLHSFLCIYP
jgi:hypothetical protein